VVVAAPAIDVDHGVIATESKRALASATPPMAVRLVQGRKRGM